MKISIKTVIPDRGLCYVEYIVEEPITTLADNDAIALGSQIIAAGKRTKILNTLMGAMVSDELPHEDVVIILREYIKELQWLT